VFRAATARATPARHSWPSVAIADSRRRSPRGGLAKLLTAALVLGLHVGIVALLLARPIRITVLREAPAMEITYLPRSSVTTSVAPRVPSRDLRRSAAAGVRSDAPGKSSGLELLRNPSGRMPSSESSPAESTPAETSPPVDWAGEMGREAARTAASQAPAYKDFGFPRLAESPSTQGPEFGWNHAHTHRVEQLPGGGVVLNLSDRCVLVFAPFPFPFCGVGTKPANGDLFKDLKDSQR